MLNVMARVTSPPRPRAFSPCSLVASQVDMVYVTSVMHRLVRSYDARLSLLRQDAAQTGAPCGAASARRKSPQGGAQDARPVRCAHMGVRSANPVARSRTRSAGCPESAPPGVSFFGCFLCTSKESNPLGRRPSVSFAVKGREKRGKSSIPAFAGMTSKSEGRKQRHWIPAFAGTTKNGMGLWILAPDQVRGEKPAASAAKHQRSASVVI
jgi:hypothetical protein